MSDEINKEGQAPESSSDSQKGGQDSTPEGFDRSKPQTAEGGDTPGEGQGGTDTDGKDIKVPKHRLDEEAKKRQEAEKRAELSQQKYQELEQKMNRMAEALSGADPKESEAKKRYASLAEEYKVPQDFVEKFVNLAKEEVTQEVESKFKPVQQQQAAISWQNEVAHLEKEVPEAKELTKEEQEKMRKMAYSPAYSKVPLADIYKIIAADKPRGNQRTAESAGGGRSGGSFGEPDFAEKIKSMSLDEFRKFSERAANS